MANWNSEYRFNATTQNSGFMWNGAKYVFIVNLTETFGVVDNISSVLARLVLTDKAKVKDTILQSAFYGYTETIGVTDKTSLVSFFDLMDKFGIKDDISELTVMAFLRDDFSLVEEIKQLTEVVISDNLAVKDNFDVEAFMSLAENMSLDELKPHLESFLKFNDNAFITDRTPQTAETDFLIGETSDRDKAYDWFLPFDMKVDWGKSTIQVMPEAELTSIEMPGIDGSIIENTVYKDRLFQIVAYSEQGMTQQEKEDLKREITRVLDLTKNQSRKLTVQSREVTFDVKYDGAANITEGPSYVRLTAPFRTPPYGYDMFDNILEGSGLIENKGAAPVGVIHTITGPISSLTFTLGDVEYKYSGDIERDSQLIINHETYTCYIQDGFGNKTNALANLSGEFQKIPKGCSVVLSVDDDLKLKFKTTWVTKRLW